MTKTQFRISYDDEMKLRPILEAFGQNPFTITDVQETCLPSFTSGDIQRFNSSLYIVSTGTIKSEKKYRHVVMQWKLTDRTVTRLTNPPGTRR